MVVLSIGASRGPPAGRTGEEACGAVQQGAQAGDAAADHLGRRATGSRPTAPMAQGSLRGWRTRDGRAPTARTVCEAGGLAGFRISTVRQGGVWRFTAAGPGLGRR